MRKRKNPYKDHPKDRWIHFSNFPTFGHLPKKIDHPDPAGFYFYPEGLEYVKPKYDENYFVSYLNEYSKWIDQNSFKYIAKIDVDNVLDLSTLTPDDWDNLHIKLTGKDPRTYYSMPYKNSKSFKFSGPDKNLRETLIKHKKYGRRIWQDLQDYFNGTRNRIWANKLKKLGYDAIFDDSGSVWPDQPQVIVFDIKNIEIIEKYKKLRDNDWERVNI